MDVRRRTLLKASAGIGAGLWGARRAGSGEAPAAGPSGQAVPEPLPGVARFEGQAYGLFLHWGLYSQLGRGEWVMHHEKIPRDTYRKLRDTFTAKAFDGRAIARMAREAGMRYITLTSRHHEGFSLYDTRGLSDWDVMHSPAKRDLIKEFVDGCRAEGIAGPGVDFGLATPEGVRYLFVHHLGKYRGRDKPTVKPLGPGPRTFTGVGGKVTSAKWLDTGERIEILAHDPAAGRLKVKCTGFPYGTDTVVRVMRLA